MKQPEGVFFVKTEGVWQEVDRWPKGRNRARLVATKNGETSQPFGDYTITQARATVEDFKRADLNFNLGYDRFVIVPQAANEMTPEVKARLRKLAKDSKERKAAKVVAETPNKAPR